MSDEVVSAEDAQGMLDRDRIAREVYGLHGGYDGARLARTVIALHRELAVLRAQLGPLCAVHDALVAAARDAGWRDADATGESLVVWVRRGAMLDAARIAENRGHMSVAMAIVAALRGAEVSRG